MSRSHPFDPIRPHFTLGRMAAGAIGGIVGGLLFGTLLLSTFLTGDTDLGQNGIAPMMTELLGITSPMQIWAVHSVMSIFAGVVFAFIISPTSYRSSILYGLLYSQILWFVGSLLLLRSLTGEPIAYDPAAVYAQVGHALFGLGLGVVYVAFHHEEVKDALAANSAKWRAWGRREEQEEI